MQSMAGIVTLGTIGKPHGIKGEVFCDLRLEDLSLLDAVQVMHVAPPTPGAAFAPCPLLSWREHKGRVLLRLEGIESRDQAEALRGFLCGLDHGVLPRLENGEVFCHQILGCVTVLEHGERLGVIEDVQTPAPEQELWIIRTDGGKEVLFPAHSGTVLDIDLEAGVVRIAPPEGLLDIYLNE